MNAHLEDLIAGFLDGSLDAAMTEELLAMVRSDENAARSLDEAWEMHQELRHVRRARSNENVVQRILNHVRAESEGSEVRTSAGPVENSVQKVKKQPRSVPPEWKQKSGSWLPWAMVAATLAVAVILFIVFRTHESPIAHTPEAPRNELHTDKNVATIEFENGDLELARAQDISKGTKGTVLQAADRITTHASRAAIRLNDGSTIELDANTTLSFDENQRQRIILVTGCIFTAAKHQLEGSPLVFHTEAGDATVIGTTFELSATSKCTVLGVADGAVRLESPAGSTLVSAGYVSSVVASQAPRQPNAIPPDEIARWRHKAYAENILVDRIVNKGEMGWHSPPEGANIGSSTVPSELRAGRSAMQVKFSGPGLKTFTQDILIEPGAEYSFELWVKLNGCTAACNFRWHESTGKDTQDQNAPSNDLGEANEWKFCARTITAPANARTLLCTILLRSSIDGPAIAWFDNCVLRKVKAH